MKKIVFVTGNAHKKEIAEAVFSLYDIELETIDLDLEEIQESSIEKIAIWSALRGAEKLKSPIIKTDVGFSIDALNGFPGAFGKYVFPQLGADGLLRLMEGKQNKHATSTEILVFARPDGTFKTWSRTQDLEILTEASGVGSAIDQIMQVVGQHNTSYANLHHEEKIKWWQENDNYFHHFAKWFVS